MRHLATAALFLFACSDSKYSPISGDLGHADSGHTDGGGAAGDMAKAQAVPCSTNGTEITTLPTCSQPAGNTLVVSPGCIPNVDGTLHDSEWSDGSCFVVGDGDMTVVMKYAGDSIYMATSGQPTCGCGMPFYFDPDGSGAANGNEFLWVVFDDPFNTDGDHSTQVLMNGAWVNGNAPAGIESMCPGNQPTPVRYEWKIPLAAVAASPGASHSWRFAINHNSQVWPSTLEPTSPSTDPTTWGTISSANDWQ